MLNNMGNKKVLVSLTVIRDGWKKRLAEINENQIEEIALFPTVLDVTARKELYKALDESCVKSIPHVHLRHDMELGELEYFVEKYGTEAFNIHPTASLALVNDLSKYSSMIYVENAGKVLEETDLQGFAGICLDFSHWDDYFMKQGQGYDESKDKIARLAKNFKIGCGHVSAMKTTIHPDVGIPGRMHYDEHVFENLSEFDYMKRYKQYMPEYISIELENSIKDQLRAKEYLEKIINN